VTRFKLFTRNHTALTYEPSTPDP